MYRQVTTIFCQLYSKAGGCQLYSLTPAGCRGEGSGGDCPAQAALCLGPPLFPTLFTPAGPNILFSPSICPLLTPAGCRGEGVGGGGPLEASAAAALCCHGQQAERAVLHPHTFHTCRHPGVHTQHGPVGASTLPQLATQPREWCRRRAWPRCTPRSGTCATPWSACRTQCRGGATWGKGNCARHLAWGATCGSCGFSSRHSSSSRHGCRCRYSGIGVAVREECCWGRGCWRTDQGVDAVHWEIGRWTLSSAGGHCATHRYANADTAGCAGGNTGGDGVGCTGGHTGGCTGGCTGGYTSADAG